MARVTSLLAVALWLLTGTAGRVPDRIATPLWHTPADARGVPATDGRTIYGLTDRHEVVALSAASGVLHWKQRIGEGDERTAGSKVVLSGDVVVVGDYDVFGLDRTNGNVRWRFAPPVGYGPGVYLGAAAKGVVFTGSPAGRIYAIEAASGRPRWTAVVSDDGKTTVFDPLTRGRLTLAAYTTFTTPATGGVIAVESTTGRERWRTAFPRDADSPIGTNAAGGPVATNEWVIAASGDGAIHVLDQATGAIEWSFPRILAAPPLDANGDFRALTLTGRVLVAGSLRGAIVAYDLDTRRERWRQMPRPGASVGFTMASDGCCIYVPYADGALVALNLSDGTERWRAGDWRSGFHWRPAIGGTRVFVTSPAGFFAFAR